LAKPDHQHLKTGRLYQFKTATRAARWDSECFNGQQSEWFKGKWKRQNIPDIESTCSEMKVFLNRDFAYGQDDKLTIGRLSGNKLN